MHSKERTYEKAYQYPFYAVQWHPEKNAFVYDVNQHINHTVSAIAATQYFANFFVREAGKSTHRFFTEKEEVAELIDNYHPIFLGYPFMHSAYYFNITSYQAVGQLSLFSVSGTATLTRNVHRMHTATVSAGQPLSLAMCTGCTLLQCQWNSHSPSQCAQDAHCYSVSGTATLRRNVHRMHIATVSAEQPLSLAMCTGCTLLQCQRNSHSPSQCAQDAHCYSVSGTATLPRNVHRMHTATVSAEQPLSLAMCTGCTLLQCQRNSHSPSQCAQDAHCYSVSGTATLLHNVHRMHTATVSAG
ncbi:hypothetical protein LSAT2_023842 [Lamellibrachia satsuma]|nr:hypothetical protein LSAT2_023842 [Lamellibrachia satsuma]